MQRYRTVIILALLVVVPLAAVFVAAHFLLPGTIGKSTQAEAKPATAPTVKKQKTKRIFAAARGLPVGTLLTEDDLTVLDLPAKEIGRGHFVMDGPEAIDALRGHAVRVALVAGTPLGRSAVVGPGQRGFLAAALRPGTRAVTIRLGAGTRHAGLIDPGDRVDVILTAELRLADGTDSVLTRRILEDVRVVAVDRQIGREAGETQTGDPIERKKISTATLEVLPAQADRLALGEHQGMLSLAVRSLAPTADPGTRNEAVDLQELLSLPAANEETAPQPPMATPRPPVEEPAMRTVLLAARALPVGMLLNDEDLTEREIPADRAGREQIVLTEGVTTESLRGYAMRETVGAGAILAWSSVVGPGQRGFLAAVLKPGTRAVTIQLGAGTRHAGLVDPGDRVDVILTAKLRLEDGTDSVLTRRILEDVRVIAVDRRLGNRAGPPQPGSQVERTPISTATLEVAPAQADRLALGEHRGTLSLAVRSLAATAGIARGEAVNLRQLFADPAPEREEKPGKEVEPSTPAHPVSVPNEVALAPPKSVRIIRGSKLSQETFSVPGGPQPDQVRVVRGSDPDRSGKTDDRRSGAETEPSR